MKIESNRVLFEVALFFLGLKLCFRLKKKNNLEDFMNKNEVYKYICEPRI